MKSNSKVREGTCTILPVFSERRAGRKKKWSGPLILLDEPALTDLKWWINHLALWNGKSVLAPTNPDVVFDTDASNRQWGAVCHRPWATRRGLFRTEESKEHITSKELKAILFGLQSFGRQFDWRNLTLSVRTDNLCALSYVNNYGGSIKHLCNTARKIFNFLEVRNLRLIAVYLPGELNHLADWQSRRPPELEDRRLNPEWFKWIRKKLGPLETDCFASRHNTQLIATVHCRRPGEWTSSPRC